MKMLLLLSVSVILLQCKTEVGRKLVWSDEFNTTGQPDTSRWNYDLGDGCPNVCGWGNNELEYYTKDSKNVRIENDMLIIEAHKDSVCGKAFTSTRLVSKFKGDWLYGRIEVKARLPKGKGTWPAIWMLSTDWKYGGWPASGEIDIMEHVGYDAGVIHGTIHTEAYNHVNQTQKEGKIIIADAQNAFHVYALDWGKNTMDFYVDDKLYHSVKRGAYDTYKEWPFDQRFHLIMNVAVGGNWGGAQGIDDAIWPQKLEVDYVRVYQ
ncbi:MAG: glycoside hydrolase family 16 protein [Bacteroidia bacterium]|nr:glycoside hydrolase family 16 protein [Bacteroidia bacterium]